MFPILLHLQGRLLLVVGGGAVGRRKAAAARAAGAAVRVADPRPRPIDLADPGIEWLPEPYHPRHLAGVRLAFAAATPEVNARVVADAAAAGVWVNAATGPAAGDFALPAVVRRDGFVLAVGTGGASPAFARRVREKLEAEFDEAVGRFVELLGEMRSVVQAEVGDPARRRELLDALADWAWLDRLRRDGADAVRAAMLAQVLGTEY